MKVSIITAAYNSAATIRDTLESVRSQDYKNIEHILVDGKSKDETVSIIKSFPHVAKCVSEKDKGLYDAINKGITIATGDVIGILNSDDFFPDTKVISKIAATFKEKQVDAVYGNVAFVKPGNLGKVVRLYSSKKFTPRKFAYGYMPAHPSFYVKKEVYDKLGLYKVDYKIAADYELLMRLIYKNNISYAFLEEVLVMMRTGGVSNRTLLSRYTLNKEIIKACKENGVNTNMAVLSLKYFNKIFEFIKPALTGSGK
jgi:glycosyltransferase involved in cell wall biosynthesis